MLRFQCFLGAKGPLITKGERQCSVFGSVFGTFERVCSVFQAIFMPFSVPKVDGFHRLEWVGMLRFRQLDDILRDIDKHYLLKFKYVSAFGAESDMAVRPAFVRYFKQRWYVIGVKATTGETDEKKHVRCLPFDCISYLKVICENHPLSTKMKKFLAPESYYENCFGIMRMENEPVEKIRIRVFYPEYNLIEEVPLHESQQRLIESKDGMYRVYELMVRPSRDFLQELLWHGRNIMVLQPESLRQKMIDILKDMTRSYETGVCTNGEQE